MSTLELRGERPEDTAFLDGLHWRPTSCARCQHPRVPTTEVGHIPANTGPGWSIRFCRGCVLVVLADQRRRTQEENRPYAPQLPEDVYGHPASTRGRPAAVRSATWTGC